MNAPYPYVQADPAAIRSKDEGDLNTLSILHYVWTALLGCSTLGIVAYFLLIAGVVADSGRGHGTGHEAAAAGIVLLIGVFIALFTVPVVVLHFVAAAGLKKHTRYILIMVMAGFTCLSFPLGTALGVWTFMVLGRPSVKALFGRA